MNKLVILLGVAAIAIVGFSMLHETLPDYGEETNLYLAHLKNLSNEINSQNGTWQAGFNKRFAYMSKSAIMGLMGALEDPYYKDLPIKEEVRNDIPASFDPREQWPNCESLKEVRDQANCGSCWAFGAAEAMSDRWCISSGQKAQDRISAEDLLDCCGFTCGMGCNGGYPSSAWSYFKSKGLSTGDLHGDTKWCKAYSMPPCDHHVSGKYGPCPAVGPTPSCQQKCGNSISYSQDKNAHKGSSVYGVSSKVSAIQTELMTNGPAEAAFTVYEDFLTYKSGVYSHQSGSALGGHAVKIMGWGTENGTDYWLVANSWNEGWGDNGFFKIKRGNNECGMEGSIVAGDVKGQ